MSAVDSVADLLDEGARATRSVLEEGMRAGRSMFRALTADPGSQARRVVDQASGLLRRQRRCDCDVPPPCWMPVQLADVVSHVCPGAEARIRFRITNCAMEGRQFTTKSSGAGAGLVSVAPPALFLGPFERGELTATFSWGDDAEEEREALVWVHGCRTYVMRWIVRASDRGCATVHEVTIEDCPDLVHHWYDHFYCARPCFGTAATHG